MAVRQVVPTLTSPVASPEATEAHNRLVKDPSVAVSMSRSTKKAPFLPSRPRLPQADAPRRASGVVVDPRASRLARVLGEDPLTVADVPSHTSQTQALIDILGAAESTKLSLIELATASRGSNMEKLNVLQKKQSEVAQSTKATMNEADSGNFYVDFATCFFNSVQIVFGGIVFNTPGCQTLGAGMVASGAIGVGAQVMKSLGFDSTFTGAVSIIAAAIGMSTGAASYAVVQGSRADAVMKLSSVGKALLNLIVEGRKGVTQAKLGELRAEGETSRARMESQARKVEGDVKRLSNVVTKHSAQAAKAMQAYASQLHEVKKRMSRVVA